MTYLIVKALHIVSLIAWMAAMFYLPRLMVYHVRAEPGSDKSETFKMMERRLLTAIATPAMAATWIFGLWLAWLGGWWSDGWLHAKVGLVVAMSACHGLFARWVRTFAADANVRSERFYRIANEVPTLLLVAIVFLVVLKPF